MAQNVQLSSTFNINTESIQIDELSLFNEPTVNQTTIESTTSQRTASETFTTPNPSVNDEIANKRTIIESTTPQRTTSDTFTTPSVNDENKLIKSTRSSKIPTMKKSLVITPKTETNTASNLCARIGPNRKSILPVAKPIFKSVISMAKENTASPRIALKSIGNMGSSLLPTQSKKFYSTSTPTPALANRKRLKVASDYENGIKKRYTLSNIDITGIHSDGDDQLVDAIIHKSSEIKN